VFISMYYVLSVIALFGSRDQAKNLLFSNRSVVGDLEFDQHKIFRLVCSKLWQFEANIVHL